MKIKMNRRIFISFILFFISMYLSMNYYNDFYSKEILNDYINITYDIKSNSLKNIQLFYKTDYESEWQEEKSINCEYVKVKEYEKINMRVPIDTKKIRLDLGNEPGVVWIKDFQGELYNKINIDIIKLLNVTHDLKVIDENSQISMESTGYDPFIEINIENSISELIKEKREVYKRNILILSIVTSIIVCFFAYFSKKILVIFKNIFSDRKMILSLAKNDFKTKYASSYLGVIWSFIQPLVSIGIFWFVFQVGFKSQPVLDVPFILWLIPGIIPWNYFSECLNSSANCIVEYGYIVKKIVLKTEVLPIIKIISSLYVHGFFIVFIFIVYFIYGYKIDIFSIQVIYYSISMTILLVGIGLITSSITVFFKDMSQLINIFIQLGFWITPIFWSYDIMPEKYLKLIKLNPIFYIVDGYRDAFINKIWFWEKPILTLNYWIITGIVLIIGLRLFKKLKPHFPDVL